MITGDKIRRSRWRVAFRSTWVIACLLGSVLKCGAAQAERLFFLSDGQVLQGCIYKPEGKGPFPTIVFMDSAASKFSEGRAPVPEVSRFFIKHGFALFVPGRHGPTGEEDSAAKDPATKEQPNGSVEDKQIAANEREAESVLSGIVTLKAQSYVDPKQIFVIGCATGGTIGLLLAKRDCDVRGYVFLSPAAQVWTRRPLLQEALKKSVQQSKAPIFVIQPQNDYNLGPITVLGKELEKKGPPNRTRILAPYGANSKQANSVGVSAPEIWGDDVLAFFRQVSK